MATLSNSIYDHLSKDFEKATLAFTNAQGEVHTCDGLVTLKRTKNKISTKWDTIRESTNKVPFNLAAIMIRGKVVDMFSVNIDSVGAGTINVDFDSE